MRIIIPITSVLLAAKSLSVYAAGDEDCELELYEYWNPYNTDHFYTSNWSELGSGNGGYSYLGVAAKICQKDGEGRLPLYRYYNAHLGNHFYTSSPIGQGGDGYVYEGVVGYVFANDGEGRTPFYKYYNPTNYDHRYTADWNLLGYTGPDHSWEWHGVVGYVRGPGNRRAVPSHLKYFGYYGSGFGGGSIEPSQIIDELKNYTNIVWPSYTKNTSVYEKSVNNGLKMIVDVGRIFFIARDGETTAEMSPNYLADWAAAAKVLRPYENSIYAFSPIDEPYRMAKKKNISWSSMRNTLETIANSINAEFPNTKLLLNFTGENIQSSQFISPQKYDLIGFDHYFGKRFPVNIAQDLMSKTYSNQKLFLIPRAIQGGQYVSNSNEELKQRQRVAYDIAAENERFVGFFPFLWQSAAPYTGARELPGNMSKQLNRMGREISRK